MPHVFSVIFCFVRVMRVHTRRLRTRRRTDEGVLGCLPQQAPGRSERLGLPSEVLSTVGLTLTSAKHFFVWEGG